MLSSSSGGHSRALSIWPPEGSGPRRPQVCKHASVACTRPHTLDFASVHIHGARVCHMVSNFCCCGHIHTWTCIPSERPLASPSTHSSETTPYMTLYHRNTAVLDALRTGTLRGVHRAHGHLRALVLTSLQACQPAVEHALIPTIFHAQRMVQPARVSSRCGHALFLLAQRCVPLGPMAPSIHSFERRRPAQPKTVTK